MTRQALAGLALVGLLLLAGCETTESSKRTMPELDLEDEPDTNVTPPAWYKPDAAPSVWDLGPEPEYATAAWRQWCAIRYNSRGLVRRINQPPEIDGALADPFWEDAAFPTAFVNVEGEQATPATALYMTFDAENLYIGARMAEPQPDKLSARVGADRRDGPLGDDDHIEVHLAPGWRSPPFRVYRIRVNSKGAVADAADGSTAWNPEIEAKAAVGAGAWTVEVAVPLESLGVEPIVVPGSVWACRAVRRRYAGGDLETTAWTRLLDARTGACNWGHVRFEGGEKTEPEPEAKEPEKETDTEEETAGEEEKSEEAGGEETPAPATP
ncbi:MAG: sugar-binding protein [Planctomycetota bacterium]